MPKITINEKDYYTDDFDANQLAAYNEIIFCNGEQKKLMYHLELLKARSSMLLNTITEKNDDSKKKE
jgi:hypothetical protein